MNKIIALLSIILLVFSPVVSAVGQSPSVEDLEKRVNDLREEIKNGSHLPKDREYSQVELMRIHERKLDEFGDAMVKYLEASWKVLTWDDIYYINDYWQKVHLATNKVVQEKYSQSGDGVTPTSSLTDYTLESGDYLILRYSNPPGWAAFTWQYHHAVVIRNGNLYVHAPGIWYTSQYGSAHEFVHDDNLIQIILVKPPLTSFQKNNIRTYIANNLLNKPYANVFNGKYDTTKYYCTSLIWRAHISSWAYQNLDGDTSTFLDIVYPLDLILPSFVNWHIYVINK